MKFGSNTLEFRLPGTLACPKPTEERRLDRDEVRLLVTHDSGIEHRNQFHQLSEHLQAGDVLVVNTSATQPAAFPIALPGGRKGMVHFSTKIEGWKWLVEIREINGNETIRWNEGESGMFFRLPGNAKLELISKYYSDRHLINLWASKIEQVSNFSNYMDLYGQPIKYTGLDKPYPLEYYQTLFSFHPGSAEMPSAGRGFTQKLVDKLLRKGVQFVPILLHTGVSSLEENEPPYPEYMEIEQVSASIINHAKMQGKRIIAVGTTAVRAIESAVNEKGKVIPFAGETNLIISDQYDMKITDGMLTGFHEPKASHLNILVALAGLAHTNRAYSAALENNYFWHQFGDLHLILP